MLPTIALFAAVLAPLAPGDPLPELKGEYLSGGPALFPHDTRGKAALLAISFTIDGGSAVADWISRYLQDFDHHPRIISYDLAMLGGVAKMGKGVLDSNLRRSMPTASHKHVITGSSGTGAWKKRVGFKSPKDAYLILIDSNGIVRWTHAGVFDEPRYRELAAEIRKLIQP